MLRYVYIYLALICLPTMAWANDKDPWEEFNRTIFSFNEALDRSLLKPTAKAYDAVAPDVVSDSLTAFFRNLSEFRTIANDLLQGKVKQAGLDTSRLLVNSTVGFLGFFDVARHIGLPRNEEDFGQTLATWGVPAGPYIMLPFIGPNTLRSTAAYAPDLMTSATGLVTDDEASIWALRVTSIIDRRAALLSAEELISGDRYTFLRDAYLQQREFLAKDGQIEDTFGDDEFEDFDF